MKKFFKNHIAQSVLLFILFVLLAGILTNMPFSEIQHKTTSHIDAYLVTWIWSWEAHILPTQPLELFNSNIFAPFDNTLAFSESMLGSFLLAWPILLIFNNAILAYNIVILLSFAISGLGAYLLVFYLTKNKLAACLAAIIYAFAPFKLIHGIEHLHITGMWLPYVFLYLHKFFNKQSWPHTLLLTLFIFLVFLTSFHYFIFLPIVILIFLISYLLTKKFRFNKHNITKVIISLLILFSLIIPLILPYFQVKNNYQFTRPINEIEDYSPDLIDYFISPFLYSRFYSPMTPIEIIVGPGLFVILLFLLSLYLIKRNYKNFPYQHKIFFIIYSSIALIAWLVSFGYYIQFTPADTAGMPGPFALLYHLIPGFSGIRSVGRYSIFFLLGLTVFIGYGLHLLFTKHKELFKKLLFSFLIISLLLIEFSFVPATHYRDNNLTQPNHQLYNWLKTQDSNYIFLELPMGINMDQTINYDVLYVFNSRYHFRKIVNGYSGYTPPGYFNLVTNLKIFEPHLDIPLIKEFQVNYLIFHFDKYTNTQQIKQVVLDKVEDSQFIEYVTNFDDSYVFRIIYD